MLIEIGKWLLGQLGASPVSRLCSALVVAAGLLLYGMLEPAIEAVRGDTDRNTAQIDGLVTAARIGNEKAEERYLGLIGAIGDLKTSIEAIKTDVGWLVRAQRPREPAERER